MRVGVVGGGVIGASTALRLLESQPNLEVTLVSDRDFSEATSAGPVGIHRLVHPELRQWGKLTFDRFCELSSFPNNESGIQLVSGHVVSNDYVWLKHNEDAVSDIVFNFRWLQKRELQIFNEKFNHGIFLTTFTSQGNKYVPWMQKQFLAMGGSLLTKKVESFEEAYLSVTFFELSKDFDVVFNCGGGGGGRLAGDSTVFPVRGVLIQVKANWIKHFLFAGGDKNYIIPGQDSVFIGGSREKGDTSTAVSPKEREAIWRRSVASMPSLKEATIVGEWAGMRPARTKGPRVELERVPILGAKPLTVIHNYGHGGNGFTLSWGCATSANLLLEQNHRKSSKL